MIQWMAIGLVFAGVFFEMLSGNKKHAKEEHKHHQLPTEDIEAKVIIGKEEESTTRRAVPA